MLHLPKSETAWQRPEFNHIFIKEIHQLGLSDLPLQKALTYGNYASRDNMKIMILSTHDEKLTIHIKIGVFFTGIITGCQCTDDPTPGNEQNEYCELAIKIEKNSAITHITLLT